MGGQHPKARLVPDPMSLAAFQIRMGRRVVTARLSAAFPSLSCLWAVGSTGLSSIIFCTGIRIVGMTVCGVRRLRLARRLFSLSVRRGLWVLHGSGAPQSEQMKALFVILIG